MSLRTLDPMTIGSKAFPMRAERGIAVAGQGRQRTDVYTDGAQYGRPNVQSATTTEDRIWYRTEDGREQSVVVVNGDLPFLPGHVIEVVSAKDGDTWLPLQAMNVTTGSYCLLRAPRRLAGELGLFGIFTDFAKGAPVLMIGGLWFLVFWAIALPWAMLDRNPPILGILLWSGIAGLVGCVWLDQKGDKAGNAVADLLKRIANESPPPISSAAAAATAVR